MLHLRTFFVKEQVAFLKLADTYDIFNPETGEQVGVAKEEPGTFIKVMKLFINKKLLPTSVFVYPTGQQQALFRIRRGVAFLRTKVTVLGADGGLLGYFKSKMFSLGGGFYVYGADDQQMAEVKGDWKGWNFQILGN